MKLLVLEDDPQLAPELLVALGAAGFAVDHASTIAGADLLLAVNRYDCAVFDRRVPDGDGLALVAELRSRASLLPVILLTARGSLHDRIEGFETGADDYLVKPFAFAELLARIRALTRRGELQRPTVMTVGDLELDVPRHRVARGGIRLSLTAKEFAVLEVLIEHTDEVVSRSELIERCWDELSDPASNVVDVLVAQLRKRLGPPDLIETVRGVGYRLGA